MTDYLPAKKACEKAGITLHALNKLIEVGKVRELHTTDITQRPQLRLRVVCLRDILDVKSGLELVFTDMRTAAEKYGVTPSAIHYHIKRHRIRWRRGGTLQPCAADLDILLRPDGKDADSRNGQPSSLETA
jgi:hypothetical protein